MQQLARLLNIMSELRNPQSGCPWDLKQDYRSLVPYTLEEAYEVVEAIESGDREELKKELGDLLFQVVFYAQLAKEEHLFDFEDIAKAVADKMLVRHPHVFCDHHYEDEQAFLKAWEQQKEREKQQAQAIKLAQQQDADDNLPKLQEQVPDSLMDGISQALPAMTRALKIQKKAAHIGFDWQQASALLPVIQDELKELSIELEQHSRCETPDSLSSLEDELGDVLFSCVNLARKLKLDPEQALRRSNHKFMHRFRAMEQYYRQDRLQMEQASLAELDQVWQTVKKIALLNVVFFISSVFSCLPLKLSI